MNKKRATSTLPILTEVKDGQPYVDEPVYVCANKLGEAVRRALKLPYLKRILVAYTYVKLRWMKPDGNGGVVPR